MKIRSFAPYIVLACLSFLLFATNYKPGTFLIGWDSLHPEFNFSENIHRSLFSVWQEYRGLGLLDGMAHAANLPHTALLWLLHFIFPMNVLRYVFILLMHAIGGIGMYFLLYYYVLSRKDNKKAIACIATLFFLFNFVTIQMFYAPFEVFAVHFGFLPWLSISLWSYLRDPNRKHLLAFFTVSFLSLPQAFVPQVFFVYLLHVSFILFMRLLQSKKAAICTVATAAFIVFSINASWGLPFIYHVKTNAQTIIDAKINQMASEDMCLKNKVRGDLVNIVLLKGFMFDATEYNENGNLSFIMEPWRKHADGALFNAIGFLFFLISLLGLLSLFRRRDPLLIAFGLSFVASFFFLATNIFGLSAVNEALRNAFPLFREALRFPFTKFATVFAFSATVFFAVGLSIVNEKLTKVHCFFGKSVSFAVCAALLYYAYPAFTGNFFFADLRVRIPTEYFQTVDFFTKQGKETRIATFPQPTFWSWRFHRDGYRGSGFLWQGVAQPMLDRSFDPWSSKNENYYHELSRALYAKNVELFGKVLKKYDVSWLIIDRNVVYPPSHRALFVFELEDMLSHSDRFILVEKFGNIKVYRVNQRQPGFVYAAKTLPVVAPTYRWNNYDRAFLENGPYVSCIENCKLTRLPAPTRLVSPLARGEPARQEIENSLYYPFRSLFTGRSQDELLFRIVDEGESFRFEGQLPKDPTNYVLEIPQVDGKSLLPDVLITDNTLRVNVRKEETFRIDPTTQPTLSTAKNCNYLTKGRVWNEIQKENGKQFVRLAALDGNNCSAAFFLPTAENRLSYLITIEHRNITGKSLLFWLENVTNRRADIETYLPKSQNWVTSYFIQPPMEEFGLGYSLHFDNDAIGREESVNDLGSITITPIPYEFLTSLVASQGDALQGQALERKIDSEPLTLDHPNPSLYIVNVNNATIILSQSFDPGWKAYEVKSEKLKVKSFLTMVFPFLFGKELKEHVMVNNWANGWVLPSTMNDKPSTIVLVYLPQYLEYIGFFLLAAAVMTLTVWKRLW